MFTMIDNYIYAGRKAFGGDLQYTTQRTAVNTDHIKALVHNAERNKVEVWFSNEVVGDSVPMLVSGTDARKLGWQFQCEQEEGLLARTLNEALYDDNPSLWSD